MSKKTKEFLMFLFVVGGCLGIVVLIAWGVATLEVYQARWQQKERRVACYVKLTIKANYPKKKALAACDLIFPKKGD